MAKPTDFVLSSLRGGANLEDPAHAIADDECTVAENVEFFDSTLGERRKGCEPIDVTDCGAATEDVIVLLTTHLPELSEVTEAELWAVGATDGASTTVSRRASDVWTDITPDDALVDDFPDVLRMQAASIHGKLFLAYNSSEDRMHVWDGTDLRRTGILQPTAAPTGADAGGAGTLADERFYRVRFIVKDGDDILRRSEPSEELDFTPDGAHAHITITRPSLVNEGETHWELEASSGDGNFYIISTIVVATTTYDDSTADVNDYADLGDLSADVGDYDLIPSVKFVVTDQDRLIFGGSWEDDEKDSRIQWTPVYNATGVGNDERIPLDTDNFVDLDWMEGGGLTGLSQPLNGSFYAFKLTRIYKVQRTGRVDGAYESFLISPSRGAMLGSIINGIDEYGRGCVYFLDPSVGPARIGSTGLQYMHGMRTLWARVNTSAENIACHGVYYPDKQQVHWWLAVDGNDTPNFKIVSQVDEIRGGAGGTKRGWSTVTGRLAEAWCSCVVIETVTNEDDGTVTLSFRPYIGLDDPDFIQRTDVGSTDGGTTYRARIVTKPFIIAGLLNKFGAMAAALLAEPVNDPDVTIDVKLIRDFGKETIELNTDFIAREGESQVIKTFDQLSMSHTTAIQIEFSDPA